LTAAGLNFGEVSGVAVNSKGHVFVFTRSNSAHGPAYAPTAAQLLEFGPKGELIREIGKDLYGWSFAHTVRIDKNDNIWAVDKGSDMIIKFDPTGRVREVYGRRKESADDETKPWEHPNPPLPHVDGLFRQPTDVAWDSQGNTYITDGYVNSRVAKYDKNGDWVKSWGERHGSRPVQPAAYHRHRSRGSRLRRRSLEPPIQVFDVDGRFLAHVHDRRPRAAGHEAGEWQHADRRPAGRGHRRAKFDLHHAGTVAGAVCRRKHVSGRLFKVSLDGKVLGVIGKSGRQLKQFSGASARVSVGD
jgi:hypothetical protein